MKIGIITFHDGFNHGAYLQAYATMHFLQQLGHDVVIINYKNKRHYWSEEVKPLLVYRNPIRFIDYFNKRKAFKRDHKRFSLTHYTRKIEQVYKKWYDVIITGSDVVWNYDIFGFDSLYFGGGPARTQIAYAASFGWISEQMNVPEEVRKGIHSFQAISVRDVNSQRMIKHIQDVAPPIVMDPTFLLSWNGLEEIKNECKFEKPYLLVYAYELSECEIKSAKEFAKKNQLICVAVGYRQSWCDRVDMKAGPFEWLTYFKKASFVVTSTYHGTIFSIIYRRPFYVSLNDKNRARVTPLLELTQLQHVVHMPDVNYKIMKRLSFDDHDLQSCVKDSIHFLEENLRAVV